MAEMAADNTTGLTARAEDLHREYGRGAAAVRALPAMTVAQNLELPGRLAGERPDRGRVLDALARVGLAGRERRRPGQLSGGRQQRVAIARALVSRPPRCVVRVEPGSRARGFRAPSAAARDVGDMTHQARLA
ncbi:ATP-binding cassette domain-containing protein [Spirillospora sp. NPDC049024]